MAQQGAVAGARRVTRVAIQRVQVANTVAPVAQGVGRGVLQVRPFGAQMQADHGARGGDGFVGDQAFGGGVADIGLGKVHDIAHGCDSFTYR
ncbi:hypothetical protein D3C77_570950 [compost metagenome]